MQITFVPSNQTIPLPDPVLQWATALGSGMMDTDELLHLAATLAAYSWVPGAIVVEIGAYVGQTAIFMAKALEILGERVPILSIDAFERVQPDSLNPQGIYTAYVENVTTHGVKDVCLPLAAFSQDAAPAVPNRVGVLVVDGGHHYEVVSSDLELYGPKVLPGGFIFADDYGPAYPGVMRAIQEYIKFAPFTVLHQSHFVIARRDEI